VNALVTGTRLGMPEHTDDGGLPAALDPAML
jgi:hypothetical protein